jgi:hypothetical protein
MGRRNSATKNEKNQPAGAMMRRIPDQIGKTPALSMAREVSNKPSASAIYAEREGHDAPSGFVTGLE